jgi:hypothetical protein
MHQKTILTSRFAVAFLTIAAVACTSSGGTPDSGGQSREASVNNNPPAVGLGQPCGPGAPCPATFTCGVDLATASDLTGVCTKPCGASAVGDPLPPPPDGDRICADGYTGTVGTPLCGRFKPSTAAGQVDWECVVGCGDQQCPGGTECSPSRTCDH